MLWEVGACITDFDKLRDIITQRVLFNIFDRKLTPVPLSTTKGSEGSMSEYRFGL
jgi:hypothetical protein